ncbi:MAG: DsbA family protein, partial [Mesorhizobium sp.]
MSRTPFGQSFSRRNVLTSLAAIPAVALLAACSDSGEQAKAAYVKPADPATPAKPATPAAVQVPEAQGTVDMAELLKPGALPDKQLGKDDAKVTIVEYASMTCPHCAHFAETTFPDLKTKYIDSGKARY